VHRNGQVLIHDCPSPSVAGRAGDPRRPHRLLRASGGRYHLFSSARHCVLAAYLPNLTRTFLPGRQ
jgi:hypothetical protein